MSVKPYFRPKDNHDVKPDELEAPVELDELESPLPTSEVPQELQYPYRLSLTRQPGQQQYTLQQNGSMERSRGVVMLREELDKILREELDKTLKEEPNETRTDIGRS